MKIVTWNINGIRTFKTGIKKALDSFESDIICVQETKVTRDLLDEKTAIVDGYNSYFSYSRGRSGYSGVATYCKDTATPFLAEEGLSGLLTNHGDAVGCHGDQVEFPSDELMALDNEGRAIITQHHINCAEGPEKLTVINVYCPRADPEKPERKQFKLQFYKLLQSRAEAILSSGSHVIILGDVNTSHRPIDHCDPSDVEDFEENPGRKWLDHFLFGTAHTSETAELEEDVTDVSHRTKHGGKFVDTFRHFHPHRSNAFTCWSTLTGARQTNYGTRIDYIFSNHSLLRTFTEVDIMPEVEGSDHCPVRAELCCPLVSSSKCPSLCTRHMPEFAGRQQKLSRFLVKVSEKHGDEGLPGSQESGEIQENLNPTRENVLKKRPPDREADVSVHKSKRSRQTHSQSKAKGSLLDFFKPKHTSLIPSKESLSPEESQEPDDGKRPNVAQEEVTPQAEDETHNQVEEETSADKAKRGSGFWKTVFHGPPQPPLCKSHKEPCVLRTVKKAGPNMGKQFFVCARPQGHASNPQARCNFFAWVEKVK